MTTFHEALLKGQQHLVTQDQKMAKVIEQAGDCEYVLRTDFFPSLVGSIISQQLSTKATSTIRQRLVDLTEHNLSPERIKTLSIDELKSVGLSRNKAQYILKLAQEYDSQEFLSLPNMEDQDAIKFLTAFSGIGEWTAQMFLMFSLGNLDILPTKDVGIQNGIKKIYGIEQLTENDLIEIAEPWRPYRSIGSWYTWRILEF